MTQRIEDLIDMISNIEDNPKEPYREYEKKILNAINVLGEKRVERAIEPLTVIFTDKLRLNS